MSNQLGLPKDPLVRVMMICLKISTGEIQGADGAVLIGNAMDDYADILVAQALKSQQEEIVKISEQMLDLPFKSRLELKIAEINEENKGKVPPLKVSDMRFIPERTDYEKGWNQALRSLQQKYTNNSTKENV